MSGWTHGFGCEHDGEPMGDVSCGVCCRHGVVAQMPWFCRLCSDHVQEGDVLLLRGDQFYTHTVSDPTMWQAPEMDATCWMWARGKNVIWTRTQRS
jgi:hypothetical protein